MPNTTVPHMLNPYKFATYEFMRQYFSVSPSMYLQFSNGTTNIPTVGNVANYSYTDLFKVMIQPFEPKFKANADTMIAEDRYRDYSIQKDKYIRGGNESSSGYPINIDDYVNNYYYHYHGSFFASFIPIYTPFGVFRHKEYEDRYYEHDGNVVFTSNFYSTHNRTSYPSREFNFTASGKSFDLVGETSGNDNSVTAAESYLPAADRRYNIIVNNKGLYSSYFGHRTFSLNGVTTTYFPTDDNTYKYYMSFTNPGGNSTTLPAYKLLNKILTNNADYIGGMVEMEFDLIVGKNTHNQQLSRESRF